MGFKERWFALVELWLEYKDRFAAWWEATSFQRKMAVSLVFAGVAALIGLAINKF